MAVARSQSLQSASASRASRTGSLSVARHGDDRLLHALPVEPVSVRAGRMAFGIAWVKRGWVERTTDVAPQRGQEIAPTGAEQSGGGGDPLTLHPIEPFKPLCGFRRSRCLQRRNQLGRVESMSMVAVGSDEPLEGPARLAGVTGCQCVDQRVDRRGLCAVDEEVELVVLSGVGETGCSTAHSAGDRPTQSERFRRCSPSHDAPPTRRPDRAHGPMTALPRAMRGARASHPQEPHPGSRVDLRAMHGSPRSRVGSSPAVTPAARTRHARSRAAERRLGLVRCGRPSMRRSMTWG